FQENGKEVNKVLYISTKWFEKGTSPSATVFQTDPNEIVNNAVDTNLVCEAPKDLDPNDPCSVLDSGHDNPDLFMSCFDSIRQKLRLSSTGTAYATLSKLYSLPPSEQKFMAMVLTMHGEARGTRPPEENMAAVMKVIENRTRYAQERSPGSSELDVVFQSSQFSMYNPRDPNWKAAITGSSEELANAIKVYAYRNSTYRCQQIKENVCHYHVPGIDKQDWMESRKIVNVTVNGERITEHQFYAGVAWAFNPNNPYKNYARRQGYIR
ncbi:MAG: cell wall hydrolase, partial [Bacteriovoracia bacterium]